jgi:hypothetical protein
MLKKKLYYLLIDFPIIDNIRGDCINNNYFDIYYNNQLLDFKDKNFGQTKK